MLFAVHLNASHVSEGGSDKALLRHRIGNTTLCYRHSVARGLLLIASVQAALAGASSDFLSAELIGHFERRFAPQLDARAAAGDRCALKRSMFAADLVHCMCTLAAWIVSSAERQLGAACSGALLADNRLSLFAILHEPTCGALLRRRFAVAGAAAAADVATAASAAPAAPLRTEPPAAEVVSAVCGCYPRNVGHPKIHPGRRTPSNARRPAPHSHRRVVAAEEAGRPLVVGSAGQAGVDSTGWPDGEAAAATQGVARLEEEGFLSEIRAAAKQPSLCAAPSNSICVPRGDAASTATPSTARLVDAIVLVRSPVLLCVRGARETSVADAAQLAAEVAAAVALWEAPLRLTMIFLRRLQNKAAARSGALGPHGS